MGNGYIKLYRQINDNELLANDNTCWVVFTRLLLKVDRQTGTWVSGRKKMAAEFNLTEGALRGALERLRTQQMISQQSTSKKTVFTICNWSKYNQQLTSNEPQSNKHLATKQEERRKNNTTNVVSSNSTSELTSPDSSARLEEKAGSDAASARLAPLHRQICQIFGKNPERYALTDKRRRTLKTRLQHFSEGDIVKACANIAASAWHMGENDRGWVADPYWCLSSREKCEEWLNRATQEQTIASINLAEV